MNLMNKILLILVAITFLITGCDELDSVLNENAAATESIAADKEVVTIDRVVDGDTIIVEFENGEKERVRLLLIDTPESVHPEKEPQLGLSNKVCKFKLTQDILKPYLLDFHGEVVGS